MEDIQLKFGRPHPSPIVALVKSQIEEIFEQDPMLFLDLVLMVRDAGYSPWGGTHQKLEAFEFINRDFSVKEHVRDYILSAVEGDRGSMTLVDPIKRS